MRRRQDPLRGAGRTGGPAHPAIPDDLGGDSLPDLALGGGVHEEHEVRVGVRVDEAGADEKPVGLQDVAGVAHEMRSDLGDPAIRDGHVHPEPGASVPSTTLPFFTRTSQAISLLHSTPPR